jgi:hypothetical protein
MEDNIKMHFGRSFVRIGLDNLVLECVQLQITVLIV